jgi:lysophospholipase L1-like esterase
MELQDDMAYMGRRTTMSQANSPAAPAPSRARTALLATLAVALLALAGLFLAELGLRLYQWIERDTRTIVSSDLLHHRLRPNLDVVDRRADRPHRLVTNAQSFVEDREIPAAKPQGVFRIFYVGDSNVQGLVDFPDKMARRVEAELNRAPPPGVTRFEVVNTGTSSYSPYLYFALIKHVILGLSPDLIVVNVDMTDCANDSLYRRFAVNGPDGELDRVVDALETSRFDYVMLPNGLVRLERPPKAYRWLVERSAVAYYADKIVTRTRVRSAIANLDSTLDRDADWLAHEWTPAIEASVARLTDMLAAIERLARAHGVRVAFTGVPHLPQYDGRWSARPFEALAEFARATGVPYFDGHAAILERAPAEGPAALYFKTDDTHFNAAGNRVWAEA